MATLTPQAPEDTDGRQRRSGGRRSRRMADQRRAARRRRRQARIRRTALALAGLCTLAGLLVIGSVLLRGGDADAPEESPQAAAAPTATDQQTVLLVRTAERGGPATGLTLLADDPEGGASVLFLPSTTLVEIPGVGLDRLGQASQYGGVGLAVATVENALGVEVSAGIAIHDDALAEVLEAIGGAVIDVPGRLVDRPGDGTGTLAFESGEQQLNGIRLAQYWSFVARGETELNSFPRQQQVIEALVAALRDDDVAETVQDAHLRGLADPPTAERVVAVMQALGAAEQDGDLGFNLLPVTPIGTTDGGAGSGYQMRAEEVRELVGRLMPSAIPEGGGAQALALQVLNGVGRPGIGQQVDQALEGLGFRLVLSDNARSFDVTETQIVIYDESPAMVAAAERVRQALGVGTILVSRQPQSVVDLTIVVGADFAGSDDTLRPGL